MTPKEWLMIGAAGQKGSALLIALLMISILGVGVAALAPLVATERLLVTVGRESAECRYAAAAVATYAMVQLQGRADWGGALDGTAPAGLADGSRFPTVGNSRHLDLDRIGLRLPASEPGNWGADRPRWSLFAWGPVRALAPGALETPIYVAVWVADDERDGDMDPLRDTNGRMLLKAEAFGPIRGTGQVLMIVQREHPFPAALRLIDWRMPG